MKCEHGKSVTIKITPVHWSCWDGGIADFELKEAYEQEFYLKIEGCDKCAKIKCFVDWENSLDEIRMREAGVNWKGEKIDKDVI